MRPNPGRSRNEETSGALAYLDHIDSLRALAVLSVLLYHLNPRLVPGGFVGVDIFFVISGFIVCRSFSTARARSFIDFVVHFYARRLARIVPALVVCLLVSTLATVLFIPYAYLSGTSQRTGLAAFFGFSNFVLAATVGDYFSPRSEFNSFTHTWSLGVEEQYYLLFPFLFILWLRGYRRLSGALLAVLLFVSFGLSIPASSSQPDRAFYLIYYRFWELAAGALLFQWVGDRIPPLPGRTATPIAAAVLVFSIFATTPGSTPFPGAILPILGTLGFILSFRALPPSSPLARGLTHPAILYIGRISYSLYLWHWPIIVLFRWTVGLDSVPTILLALACSAGAAAASYAFVEGPLRQMSVRTGYPRVAIAGFWLVVAVAGWGMSSGLWSVRQTISLSVVNRNPTEWYGNNSLIPQADCRLVQSFYPIANGSGTSIARPACSAPTHSTRRVFVIGDSHAAAYISAFSQVTMNTGLRIDVLSSGGCGILNLVEPVAPHCEVFHAAAFASVLAAVSARDIVFLPALRTPRIADQYVLFDESGANRKVADATTDILRAEQVRSFEIPLRQLTDRGVIVILEAPLPVFRAPPFRCADWFNRVNPVCVAGLTIPRSTVDGLRAPTMAVFDQLRSREGNLQIWDPMPILCPTDTCDAMRNRRPLFFDGDHLSGFGSMILVPSLEQLFTMEAAAPPKRPD